MHVPCARRGAGVLLNISAKFGVRTDRAVGYRAGDGSSEDIDSDEISRDSESDSVSLAASSADGSGIDEIDDDDDDGSDMSDAEESHFSGQSSNEF